MTPKESLVVGAAILDEVLQPAAFVFQLREEGMGSGGSFAWGEYVRDNRRLELHFRQTLGLVTYHVGELSASHQAYMRALGVLDQCQYPGFSDRPMRAFEGLAADLVNADDFLSGDALVLRRVGIAERERASAHGAQLMARAVGDTAAVEKMRERFRAKQFREVVTLFGTLKFPERLSPADMKMVDLARRKSGG